MKIAGAPISWGVCEVPDWGCQLGRDRVLAEVASLGLAAVELGPAGFLPDDPAEVAELLARYDLRLAAGFVPAVLHDPARRGAALAGVETAAATLAAAGADVLVLAAELGQVGYDRSVELSDDEWTRLFEGLDLAREIGLRHGLIPALHPHYGTAVERIAHVERVLGNSTIPLCLDTGHLIVGGSDPADVARRARGRIAHVHLKDVDSALAAMVRAGEIGYRDAVAAGLYRALGDGDVDLGCLLELLEGYEGWYVLEQDVVLEHEPDAGAGPLVSARRSVEYLRRTMGA